MSKYKYLPGMSSLCRDTNENRVESTGGIVSRELISAAIVMLCSILSNFRSVCAWRLLQILALVRFSNQRHKQAHAVRVLVKAAIIEVWQINWCLRLETSEAL